MKIQKPILYFIAALSLLHVWDILFFQYSRFGANTWTLLNLSTLGIAIFFAYKLLNDFEFENGYLKKIFIVFMVYQFLTVIRGWSFNYAILKNNLQLDFVLWPFIIPVFVFFDKKLDTLAQLFKSFYFLGIAFLVLCAVMPSLIINRATAENFIHPFAFGCAFLLLNTRYLSKQKAIVCFLVTLVAMVSFIVLARRNAILTYGGFMGASLFLYVKDFSFSKKVRVFPLIAGFIVLLIFASDKIPASLTNKLNERLTENTRSVVFDAFFSDMKNNMAFGKGMNGSYYCPWDDTETDDGITFSAVEYRNVIENGYLQLILTGGILHVILFGLIVLPAAYKGIFKSSNNLAKSCGIVILLWLIDMSVFGLPRLVLQYIFVWICIGLCYKKSFREIPEEEIYQAFKNIGLA